jgi:hypothetical protein
MSFCACTIMLVCACVRVCLLCQIILLNYNTFCMFTLAAVFAKHCQCRLVPINVRYKHVTICQDGVIRLLHCSKLSELIDLSSFISCKLCLYWNYSNCICLFITRWINQIWGTALLCITCICVHLITMKDTAY